MARTYLTRIEADGRKVFYSLHTAADLFGGCTVVLEKGRYGEEGSDSIELFDSAPDAIKKISKTIKRKMKEGYVLHGACAAPVRYN